MHEEVLETFLPSLENSLSITINPLRLITSCLVSLPFKLVIGMVLDHGR